jgi:hypothetical protein
VSSGSSPATARDAKVEPAASGRAKRPSRCCSASSVTAAERGSWRRSRRRREMLSVETPRSSLRMSRAS